MLISVIIPIYNVAHYVEQCILSVLDQTYHDLEVIIVDDCGTDDSMELVDRILGRNGYTISNDGTYRSKLFSATIQILHHVHNRGLSAARNTGINAARGEYLYFLDSDDWIYKDCITNLNNLVIDYPGVDIVQGMISHEDEINNSWINYPTKVFCVPSYTNDIKECRHRFQTGHYLSMAQNRLIKKSFVMNNVLFFKEGLLHEDEHWMIFAGKYLESIAYCRKITYFYRVNPNGIIATSGDKLFSSMCAIIDDILDRVTTLGRFRDEIDYVLSHINLYEEKGYDPIVMIKHNNLFLRFLYRFNSLRRNRRYMIIPNIVIMLFWLQLKAEIALHKN